MTKTGLKQRRDIYELFRGFYIKKEGSIAFEKIFEIIFPNHENIRRLSCVYGIKHSEGNYIYIGTTCNLYRRLTEHLFANSLFGATLRESFRRGYQYEIEIMYNNSCFNVESYLIKKYLPLANVANNPNRQTSVKC